MPARHRCGKRAAPTAASSRPSALAWLAYALAGLATSGPLAAQTGHAQEHLHTPLETSADLAWPELINATLENFPRLVELAARDAEAGALVERSRSWLAGAPQVYMRYQTDRPWDNVELREYELALELPLWRPGERRAAGTVGTAATGEASAAAMALRHEVIGLLRMALWDIELAANDLDVARNGARIAGDLQAAIERRYQAGELPLSETLLVRSTAMEREAAVIEAEARLVDAERAYQSLTGLNERPGDIAETLTDREYFDSSHPRLMLADAELERARAELDLTRRASKGTPTLGIGPQSQRGAFSNYSANSLNVSISMPFGGRAHSATAAAEAARIAAQAESDRMQLLRALDLALHEARHSLLVIEASLELAKQRAELAARSFEMNERAFAQGEITLLELLRSEETTLVTQREAAGLEAERQRAIAQINQAIGVWP
jgi:cobalt-zinc-cadmium efflux system outer membrane protein